ncbi:MAG: gamma-glutamylcyclotransferase [Pigmentiphaga sp.]|uniref:gamma-glutamylcyclotransferase family protein n=1 Tax=Pigmentiphaga sp. TaxID=1977564 RepID=UPI0029A3A88E|nr:gamma-glutamylcyclotransferase family protein [Pigmentiphaga sp.]MDX3905664.1 gamma-glutamylcyclotransferase [Pigmentiphaga sp.]
MPHVFVYGTLRRGEINDIERLARQRGLPAPVALGEASVAGRLVDFGDWPGLIEQAGPRVRGEVYLVEEALLAAMDEVEEYDPAGDSLFVRRRVEIQIGGQRLPCNYYPIQAHLVGLATPIDHDDWIAYRQTRDAGRASADPPPTPPAPRECRPARG